MGLDLLLVAGQLFSFSTLMLLVGFLTCKTVSQMTYTVLVETLNPLHSLTTRTGAACQGAKSRAPDIWDAESFKGGECVSSADI